MLSPLYALKAKIPFDDLWTGPWSNMGYSECFSHPPLGEKLPVLDNCLQNLVQRSYTNEMMCVTIYSSFCLSKRFSNRIWKYSLVFIGTLFTLQKRISLPCSPTNQHPFPLLPHLKGKLMARLLSCPRYSCSEFFMLWTLLNMKYDEFCKAKYSVQLVQI